MLIYDKLCYVAEDFDKYCQPKKVWKTIKEYMKGLAAWAEDRIHQKGKGYL